MTFVPSGESIVERKTCQLSGDEFIITDKDIKFFEEIAPVFAGKKYSIPTPTLSPSERMRRRLSFRNERSLYLRKCDLSGKQIVSMYPSDTKYRVYDKDIWYSDDWNPFTYGRDFDFERSFFEQFEGLFIDVPRMARVHQSGMENSEFCNCASKCKNSYLCFSSNQNEDCYYSTFANQSYRVVDCYNANSCENCYECMDTQECANCAFLVESTSCRDCMFCRNCVGCQNCLFCSNLRQGEYMIMNQKYSKEQYEQKKSQLLLGNYSNLNELRSRYLAISKSSPVKHLYGVNNENVSGNMVSYSKNAHECFECSHLEDCRYMNNVIESKNSMDHSYWGVSCSWVYETMAAGFNCSNLLFCDHTWENNSKLILCESCMYSSELFACNGLQRQKNCVFNKAYSATEYESVCGKIIDHMISTGEWGEFFPSSMSDFGYNETVAQDYFPLTKEEASARGYAWKNEDESQSFHGSYHSPLERDQYDEARVGPDLAKKNIDDCTSSLHMCQVTKKPFKILPKELAFYIENGYPIPVLSPDARNQIRMKGRLKRTTHTDRCDTCSAPFQTSYERQSTGKILCEECFLQETG